MPKLSLILEYHKIFYGLFRVIASQKKILIMKRIKNVLAILLVSSFVTAKAQTTKPPLPVPPEVAEKPAEPEKAIAPDLVVPPTPPKPLIPPPPPPPPVPPKKD